MIESIVTLLMQALGLVFLIACLIVTAALAIGLAWLAVEFPLAALCLTLLILVTRN
jgi:hypothetical protein